MKKFATLSLTLLFGVLASQASMAANGFPTKHSFGINQGCTTCHQEQVPTQAPTSEKCIACHGTMDKIPTPKNKFDKEPHHSAHFGNTMECSTCHAEHKESKDYCSTCHTVEWKSFR